MVVLTELLFNQKNQHPKTRMPKTLTEYFYCILFYFIIECIKSMQILSSEL